MNETETPYPKVGSIISFNTEASVFSSELSPSVDTIDTTGTDSIYCPQYAIQTTPDNNLPKTKDTDSLWAEKFATPVNTREAIIANGRALHTLNENNTSSLDTNNHYSKSERFKYS